MAEGYDEPIRESQPTGIRSMILSSYDIPRAFYAHGLDTSS
jgi:hypothetical protein